MAPVTRSALWLGFFGLIFAAWVMMYVMSTGMGLDLLGRPDAMGQMMRGMDPRMDTYMPMASFGPLAVMWAAMMAAMMLPTMIPTLRSYEDLMVSANGTRAGWFGVLLGLGTFCVACCWGFVALGFSGGVMNLAWMGLATLFLVLEKLPQIGHKVTEPMGVLLILGACVVAGLPLYSGG